MTLRTRLLLAVPALVLIPLALLAYVVRQELSASLSAEYRRRLGVVAAVVGEDLDRESAGIAERLASLERAIVNDNQFRLGAVAGLEAQRQYVLDYASQAIRLTGLSMLDIQDEQGTIVSSGRFRNEHGRVEPATARALGRIQGSAALITAHAPEGDFLALVRGRSISLGGRTFGLVGGVQVDGAYLTRLARGREIDVSLQYPGGRLASEEARDSSRPPAAAGRSPGAATDVVRIIPFIGGATGDGPPAEATLRIRQSLTPLEDLLRGTDAWFLTIALGTAAAALLLSVWMSSRMSRPLAALAEKTAVLDLDRLDVRFDDGTDEVGLLSRVLNDLAERLRSSTARIREAERRATVGDLARQINHDIKNGLIPIRNVMRHLTQVARDDPGAVASVLAERRQTLESSIAYLETLATNYERLSPKPHRRDCDLNALILDVVRGVRAHEHVDVQVHLASDLPRVVGDPVALRRILENLAANAVDSLDSGPGRVTVTTETSATDGEAPMVRMTVADTGRGMSKEESGRIFTDFYTTKPGGAGLGLSIVRRLVMDLNGTLRVDSAPGAGTRMILEIPAGAGSRPAPDPSARRR